MQRMLFVEILYCLKNMKTKICVLERVNWLSCRDILWVMAFFGFAINYMLRINMNIAIVAMVIPRSKPAASVQCNQGMPANMSRLNTNITSSLLSPNSTNSSLIISQVPAAVQVLMQTTCKTTLGK